MNENSSTITINGRSIILPAWNNLNDAEMAQITSNLTDFSGKVIDEKKESVSDDDDTNKGDTLVKASKRFKNVMLFIITGISLTAVVYQGGICTSK